MKIRIIRLTPLKERGKLEIQGYNRPNTGFDVPDIRPESGYLKNIQTRHIGSLLEKLDVVQKSNFKS
jgi:hypothetical protein